MSAYRATGARVDTTDDAELEVLLLLPPLCLLSRDVAMLATVCAPMLLVYHAATRRRVRWNILCERYGALQCVCRDGGASASASGDGGSVVEVCVAQEASCEVAFQWCGLGEAKHSSRGRSGLGKMTAQTAVAGSRVPPRRFEITRPPLHC